MDIIGERLKYGHQGYHHIRNIVEIGDISEIAEFKKFSRFSRFFHSFIRDSLLFETVLYYRFYGFSMSPLHRYFENSEKVKLSKFLEPLPRRRCCFTLRNFSQTTACFPCKRSVMPHTKIRKDPKKKHFRPWRSPIIKARVDYRGISPIVVSSLLKKYNKIFGK